MKIYVVSQFILLSYFISGGDVCAGKNDITSDPPKAAAAQKLVTAETKNQPILQKQVKPATKEQALEVNPIHDLKPPQPETEESTDLSGQTEGQPVLDLSVPVKIKKTTASSNTPGYKSKRREYLPDLFAGKKNEKKKILQVDGKIIEKEEEEIDKTRAVDGVGIDIKLTP